METKLGEGKGAELQGMGITLCERLGAKLGAKLGEGG